MSIYRKNGVAGEIVTTSLPSGDMVVRGPTSGPLEQVIFDVCRFKGSRNAAFGGWIIPSKSSYGVRLALERVCMKVAD